MSGFPEKLTGMKGNNDGDNNNVIAKNATEININKERLCLFYKRYHVDTKYVFMNYVGAVMNNQIALT
jgi:predicted phosphodiesterase